MATTLLNKPKGLAAAAGLSSQAVQKPVSSVVKPITPPKPYVENPITPLPEGERPGGRPGITPLPEGEQPRQTWRSGEFVDTRVPSERSIATIPTPEKPPTPGITPLPEGETPGRTPPPGSIETQKLFNSMQPGYNPKTGLIEPRPYIENPITPLPGGERPTPTKPLPPEAPTPVAPLPSGQSNPTMTARVNGPAPVQQAMPTGAGMPSGQTNPTMTTRVDPAAPASTAKSYAEWAAKAAAQVDDSTANKLRDMLREDSPLMQQARTDGLKTANSRGLLNSSMAAGASQDAMIRAATPIAQQDASQAFQKNLQSSDYTYGLASQFAGQEFSGDQAALDRSLQVKMQNASLNAADQQQINEIKSREGTAAAERALTQLMQDKDITLQVNESALARDLETKMQNAALNAADMQQIRDIQSQEGVAAAERALALMQQERDIKFQSGESALNRSLEERMQDKTITAADRQQIRDIESREGTAAAERALQEKLQQKDIEFQTSESGKSRELQKWIAEANLDASDRNAASQFITNMETMYQTSYQSIMANTALSVEQRTAQLQAAARMRDQQLDFVRQMYDVELTWGQASA